MELSASYDSDAYDDFLSTVLFRMLKYKILIFDQKTVKKNIYKYFIKVHESFDMVMELSASYDSDAYYQFWSTVQFRMVKMKTKFAGRWGQLMGER